MKRKPILLGDRRILSSKEFEIQRAQRERINPLRLRDLALAHRACLGAEKYSVAIAYHNEVVAEVRSAVDERQAFAMLNAAYENFHERTGRKRQQYGLAAYLDFIPHDSGGKLAGLGVSYALFDERLHGEEGRYEQRLVNAWTGDTLRMEQGRWAPVQKRYRYARTVFLPRENPLGPKYERGL